MSDRVQLTERQALVLQLVIREFVSDSRCSGVASKTLVEKYQLDISPATIRNDMAELTQLGLLKQAHTSAGRAPTESGYRYFVQQLAVNETLTLPSTEQRLIAHQFYQARAAIDQWGRLAATVLAQHTQHAAIVTALHAEQARLQHLELISTRDRQVLLVLVLRGGQVRQQIVLLSEPVPQHELSQTAQQLRTACQDYTALDIESRLNQFDALTHTVALEVIGLMRETESLASGRIYREGIDRLLGESTPTEANNQRQAIQLLTEGTHLSEFLQQAIANEIGLVQVIIAGNGNEPFRNCSLVLARYGVAQRAAGTLGVVGPLRMEYRRAIGVVRYVADMLTNLVAETYG